MRPLTNISLFGVRLATCVLSLYWIAIFTGTHIPTLPRFARRVSDKVEHFSAFFILAILLCWVLQTRTSPLRKFGIVALIAITYAALDEITQGFVRGRTTDIRDFAADSCGVLCAIGFYSIARWKYPHWTKSDGDSPLCPVAQSAIVAAIAPDTDRDQARRPRAISAAQDSINVA